MISFWLGEANNVEGLCVRLAHSCQADTQRPSAALIPGPGTRAVQCRAVQCSAAQRHLGQGHQAEVALVEDDGGVVALAAGAVQVQAGAHISGIMSPGCILSRARLHDMEAEFVCQMDFLSSQTVFVSESFKI